MFGVTFILFSFSGKAIASATTNQQTNEIDSLIGILKTTQSEKVKIKIEMHLADLYSKDDLTKAIGFLTKAMDRATEIQDDSLKAYINFNLGNYFFKHGSFDKAIEYYKSYYDYYSKEKDDYHLLYVLPNLGAVASMMNDHKKSLKYFNEAEILYNRYRSKIGEIRYHEGIIVIKNNIGNCYHNQGNENKAIAIYKQALAIAEQENDLNGIGNLCRNLGNIYVTKNKPDSAYAFLKRSYDTKKSLKDLADLSSTCLSLATYYDQVGNSAKNFEMLNEAKRYASQTGSLVNLMNIEQYFFSSYKKAKNYPQALDALVRYKELSDSVNNLNSMTRLVRTQTTLELEIIQKEKEFNLKQREMRYIIILVISIAVMFIIILLYKVLRDKYKKLDLQNKANELERKNLEQTVEIKNKELTTNVLYLVQKNELISEIIKKLYDLKLSLKGENAELVTRIIYDMKASLNTGNWEEFEMRFHNVNTEFYTKLAEKHPDLTPNERRLCALLRLNMSTKEIVALTGQNARSIEMARHRLRKKLNLDMGDNLVNFFLEL